MIDNSTTSLNMFESNQGNNMHHDLFDHELHHTMFQETPSGQQSPREFAGHSPIPDLHHIDFHLDAHLDMPFDHSHLHDIGTTANHAPHDVLTSSHLEDVDHFADTGMMLDNLHSDHMGLGNVLDSSSSLHNILHHSSTSNHLNYPMSNSSLVHPFPFGTTFGHFDDAHLADDGLSLSKGLKKGLSSPTSLQSNGLNDMQGNKSTMKKNNSAKLKSKTSNGSTTKKAPKRKTSVKNTPAMTKGISKLTMGGTNKFSKSGAQSPKKRQRIGTTKKTQGKSSKHPKISIETGNCTTPKSMTPGSTRSVSSNSSQPLKPKQTSYFRGVSCCGKDRKWQARIRDANRVRYLGRYPTEVEAALVYDRAARECKGMNAPTNFIVLDKDTTEKLKAAYLQFGEVPVAMHDLLAKSMRPRVENAVKKRAAAAAALKANANAQTNALRYNNTRSATSHRPQQYQRGTQAKLSKTLPTKHLHTPPSQVAPAFFPGATTKNLDAVSASNEALMLKSASALKTALLHGSETLEMNQKKPVEDNLHQQDMKLSNAIAM